MGRGTRTVSLLTLSPIASSDNQTWLDAFVRFEQKVLHASGEPACSPALPYNAPRFVVVEMVGEKYDALGVPNAHYSHRFTYYNTPDALLKGLVPGLRKFTSDAPVMEVWEYRDGAFNYPHKYSSRIEGIVKCFSSPCLRQPIYTSPGRPINPGGLPFGTPYVPIRAKRAQIIAAANNNAEFSTYDPNSRFITAMQDATAGFFLESADDLGDVEAALGYMALHATTFVNLYDLDVGDQPVPVSIGLRLNGPAGTTCTVLETP